MARFIGVIIGAAFGVLFVLINTGDPVNATVALALRVLAVFSFVGLIAIVVLAGRAGATTGVTSAANRVPGRPVAQTGQFSRGYWAVVAGEVILLEAGFVALRGLRAPPQARVAWVAVVVGLHFVAFLAVWRQRSILVPGILLTGYGVAGLIMAATASGLPWVPLVSGVLSGFTLLICCLLVAVRELSFRKERTG